jgi:hypothetical protein
MRIEIEYGILTDHKKKILHESEYFIEDAHLYVFMPDNCCVADFYIKDKCIYSSVNDEKVGTITES